jgi:uncharacterized membrane protein YheB (UPF0754 family)
MVGTTTSGCALGERLVTELRQVVVSDISITLDKILEELTIDELAIDGVVVVGAKDSRRNWGRR